MNKKSIILVILAASLFLSACDANPFKNNTIDINATTKYSNISHEDLNEMLQDKDFLHKTEQAEHLKRSKPHRLNGASRTP